MLLLKKGNLSKTLRRLKHAVRVHVYLYNSPSRHNIIHSAHVGTNIFAPLFYSQFFSMSIFEK